MTKDKIIKISLLGLLFLVLSFGGRYLILGGASVKNLKQSNLTDQISKDLSSGQGAITYGKDYKLEDTKYYRNNQWVTAKIIPIKRSADSAYIVMKLQNGTYETIVGPGTDFPKSSLTNVPEEVVKYLSSLGLVSQGLDGGEE